jgi:alanine racemase
VELDLDALAGNLAAVRSLAGEGVPVHPVVKADAYGHGAVPIARALAAAGADGFCVAAFDEAVDLRAAGIAQPILVLYPIPPALARAARGRRITVTAGDPALLAALLDAVAGDIPEAPSESPLAVELEIETGLGRGGFAGAAIIEAARAVEAAPGVRLAGLWSHLQAAEDPDRTAAQLERFESVGAALEGAGVQLPPRHLAASGGLLTDGVLAFDGVRPGLAIYGLIPDELFGAASRPVRGAARLRPVLSLHARPVRVADLPAGWGISYGPTFTTARPSRIATLPLGYGDGWPRSLSNRASALVRGQRVPLVGNVAMDAVMADVTDVLGDPVTVADVFVLLGEQGTERITAADLAKERGTNSWEVVTNLSARLPRVYDAASVPQAMRTLAGVEAGTRRSMRP